MSMGDTSSLQRLTCTWCVGVLVAAAKPALRADAPCGAALLVTQQLEEQCVQLTTYQHVRLGGGGLPTWGPMLCRGL